MILDGTNYFDWKDSILLDLGCMDLDLALRVTEPQKPADDSTDRDARHLYDQWERSNRLSLQLIQSRIPYASAVGSLMYAQVCTRPDIAFAVGMLGRYQSNPG